MWAGWADQRIISGGEGWFEWKNKDFRMAQNNYNIHRFILVLSILSKSPKARPNVDTFWLC